MKQPHCFINTKKINSVIFQYLNSEKSRHYVLANLPCLCLGTSGNWRVVEADTICFSFHKEWFSYILGH